MDKSIGYVEIILDNGGGTTLQYEADEGGYKYKHHYYDPSQAAEDVILLFSGEDPCDWDGNEISDDNPIEEYDPETERNGGYLWYDHGDLRRMLETKKRDGRAWGANDEAFVTSLGVKIGEE